MRILPTNGAAVAAGAAAARRTPSTGFTVSDENAPRSAGAAGGLRTVGGIDALLALQGIQEVEDPLERRKRAVKRGRIALDALDELKIGLLGGALSAATLTKLQAAAAHLKLSSGNEDLDGVLGEIELRLEVEIAKMAR
ncbi:MAG TPA: flagellar assembly protein FliX [Xanthobacteraceae bacterium]